MGKSIKANLRDVPTQYRRRAEDKLNLEPSNSRFAFSENERQHLLHELQVHQIALKIHNSELQRTSDIAETALSNYADLFETSNSLFPFTDPEKNQLLHELQVHQVELKMQNSELKRTRDNAESALANYTDLYDFAPVGYLTLDVEGVVSSVNLTGCSMLKINRSRLLGQHFEHLVSMADRPAFKAYLQNAYDNTTKDTCDVMLLREGGQPFHVQLKAIATSSQECRLVLIDISEQIQLRQELSEKVEQLETALSLVKHLEGLIPICSYCHKIRDDKKVWHRLEKYISEHSNALFTHGICPDCLTVELLKYKKIMKS